MNALAHVIAGELIRQHGAENTDNLGDGESLCLLGHTATVNVVELAEVIVAANIRRPMFWDEWRGSNDGRPAMFVKRLGRWRGCAIDLHKFIRPDDAGCFHTHAASAVRIIVRGGYVEELESGLHVTWRPGRAGIVRPALCHRVAELIDGPSWSLWLRGRKRVEIEIRGAC